MGGDASSESKCIKNQEAEEQEFFISCFFVDLLALPAHTSLESVLMCSSRCSFHLQPMLGALLLPPCTEGSLKAPVWGRDC